MKNVFLTLFAIGLAGIAAMAATTAVLNTPVRPAYIGPPKSDQPATPSTAPPTSTPEPGTPPATPPGDSAPTSPGDKPAAPSGDQPATPAGGAAEDADQADEDPYGDIPSEELPPDLQYDADSNVSFPTNI